MIHSCNRNRLYPGYQNVLMNKHTAQELADPVKYPVAGIREWAAEVRANKNAVSILKKNLGIMEAGVNFHLVYPV